MLQTAPAVVVDYQNTPGNSMWFDFAEFNPFPGSVSSFTVSLTNLPVHTEIMAGVNYMHTGWLDPGDEWTFMLAGTETSGPFYQEGGSEWVSSSTTHSASSVTMTFSAEVADPYAVMVQHIYIAINDPPVVSVSKLADGSESPDTVHSTNTTAARFLVSRSGGDTNQALDVSLQRGSSSTASTADINLPGSVTIPAGETSLLFEIPVANDTTPEWTETAVIEVVETGNYLRGASWQAVAEIADNDAGLLYQNLPEETAPSPNELSPGGFLALNCDDDNSNGVWDHLDGQLGGGSPADDDLQPLTLQLPSTAPADYSQVVLSSSGPRLWLDQNKTQPVSSAYAWGTLPQTLYVEGMSAGSGWVTLTVWTGVRYEMVPDPIIVWTETPLVDTVNIATLSLNLGTPVFNGNRTILAGECMEETELRWHVTIQGAPVGTEASVTLTLSSGAGDSEQTSGGAADVTAEFGEVPNGDPDHHYTGEASAQATINGIVVKSPAVQTEVWELWITSFRDDATGKEWKVCVGDAISYSASGSLDLTDWEWDMPDGGILNDHWNPQNTTSRQGSNMVIPFSDEQNSDNDDFGDRYGTVTVKAKDANGNWYTFNSSQDAGLKATVFFDPSKATDGTAPSQSNPPAWFVFWKQGVVPDLDQFEYTPNAQEYGHYDPVTHDLYVGALASATHYSTPYTINGITFGGATGIDCAAEVVRHEMQHRSYHLAILAGAADMDLGVGDGLPDTLEGLLGTTVGLLDTFNVSGIRGYPPYAAYGDQEYGCMVAANGTTGNAALDWSKGGKQW